MVIDVNLERNENLNTEHQQHSVISTDGEKHTARHRQRKRETSLILIKTHRDSFSRNNTTDCRSTGKDIQCHSFWSSSTVPSSPIDRHTAPFPHAQADL